MALIIFAIPMLLLSLIIKITSPGPLIFKQVRVGLHNREFAMYKFRSMRVQEESAEKKAWTTANDPRVTSIGKFKEEIPRYMIKHQVRPGMTGWAQVNGYRGDTSITKRIECDLYYVENWTLLLDFKILFLTFFGRNTNKNAY